MTSWPSKLKNKEDFIPGVLDFHFRKLYQEGGPDYRLFAKVLTLDFKVVGGQGLVILSPKRNLLRPVDNRVPLIFPAYNLSLEGAYRSVFEVLNKMVAVKVLTSVRKKSYVSLPKTQQDPDFMTVIEENKRRKDILYELEPKNEKKQLKFLKELVHDTVSSQVLRCTMVNSLGNKLIPHTKYNIQKVPETPGYILELYNVLSVCIKQSCVNMSETELDKLLFGFDRGESPYITTYSQYDRKFRCSYPQCKYKCDTDGDCRMHYNLEHWRREDKLKVVSDYPLDQFKKSCVTAGDPESIAKSINGLCRDQRNLKVNDQMMQLAVELAFLYLGYSPECLTIPKIEEVLDSLERGIFDMPEETSSGYVPTKEESGFPMPGIKYSNVTTKRLAKPVCMKLVKLVIINIYQYIKDKKLKEIKLADIKKIIPIAINLLMTKLETKVEGEELDKIRVFFVGGTIEYMLTKIFCEAAYKEYKHGPGSGIGHKWFEGDGARLCKTLERYTYTDYYDYSKFDSSLKGVLLGYVITYLLRFMKKGDKDGTTHKFIYSLALWLGDVSSAKVVEWLDGGWRLIIGYMMSGVFPTSPGNSAYAIVLDFYNMLYWGVKFDKVDLVYNELSALVRASKAHDVDMMKKLNFFFLAYGDNKIHSCNGPLREIINLKNFEESARTQFGMTIKWEKCGTCAYPNIPYNFVDEYYNLEKREWKAPNGEIFNIPHGINYLKRWPVKQLFDDGTSVVRCLRPTRDYLARLGRTPIDVRNPALEFGRNIGNIYDMCQSNPFAYQIVMAFNLALLEIAPWCEQWITRNMSVLMKDAAFRKFYYKIQDRYATKTLIFNLFHLNPYEMEMHFKEVNNKIDKNNETFEDLLKERRPPILSYRNAFDKEHLRWY